MLSKETRSDASTALAKALAFKQCGKDEEAARWGRELLEILADADIVGGVA